MSELRKPFLRNQIKKIRKQKINVKMPHVNKNTTSVKELGKPFRKKFDPKNWQNSKNQSEIAACEQKTTNEKPNFCSNTVFSLYFKMRAKKNSRRKTPRFFAPFPVPA